MLFRCAFSGVLCLLPASFLLTSSALAEPAGAPFVDDGDVPTVLTATRLQQSLLDVPAAVTVIDRAMIEQTGVREIPELLRLVPGMVVAYESGSEAFVSFHGTSADLARRMQVLIDGRSIYQPLLAAVDWIGLPLELADIERIEVIRGPNSATWGANSFFAVVNIVTRHPADVERARVAYSRGGDGIEDFHARLAQRTAGMDWRLSVAGRRDDGFETNLDPDHQRAGQTDYTDSKKLRSVYGRGVWTSEADATLELSFGAAHTDAEQQYRPMIWLETPVAEHENKYVSLAWEQDAGADHRFRLQASHSRFDTEVPWLVGLPRAALRPDLGALYELSRDCANGIFWPPLSGKAPDTSACTTPQEQSLAGQYLAAVGSNPRLWLVPPAFRAEIDAHERRTTVDLQDTWVPSADFRTVFGATYDEAYVDSQTYLGGSGENTVWRVFAHGEWRFAPAWLLNVGGNGEFDEGAGDFFSPRYALNWQFTPGQVLRLVYSEAVRTPDIFEEQADFRYTAVAANPADAVYSGTFFQTGKADGTASTETIVSREVGYYGRFDRWHVAVDLRLFRDRMALAEHNLDPTDSEGFRIGPLNRSWLSGSELGLDWRPRPGQRVQLNYAYLDMDSAVDDDNNNFVPQHSGSLAWWQDYGNGWQFGNTYAFYNDLRVGQFFYDRLETRLAKTLALAHAQQLTLAAVMQTRFTDDPELRRENGADRHRGWLSLAWRY